MKLIKLENEITDKPGPNSEVGIYNAGMFSKPSYWFKLRCKVLNFADKLLFFAIGSFFVFASILMWTMYQVQVNGARIRWNVPTYSTEEEEFFTVLEKRYKLRYDTSTRKCVIEPKDL